MVGLAEVKALAMLAEIGVGTAINLLDKTMQILTFADTIVLIFIAISTAGNVVFSNQNLFFALGHNASSVLGGLITPINRSHLPYPFSAMVENPLFLILINFIEMVKLGTFLDIVFIKAGSFVLQWYAFAWSIIVAHKPLKVKPRVRFGGNIQFFSSQ